LQPVPQGTVCELKKEIFPTLDFHLDSLGRLSEAYWFYGKHKSKAYFRLGMCTSAALPVRL
jgi:hypothetical protein